MDDTVEIKTMFCLQKKSSERNLNHDGEEKKTCKLAFSPRWVEE